MKICENRLMNEPILCYNMVQMSRFFFKKMFLEQVEFANNEYF